MTSFAGDTDAPTIPAVSAPSERPATNVPMTKLAPGDKPPQFIIFSFDGAGSHQRWNEFMAAADESNSRFTGFLSGIYLLGDSAKDAGAYTGPGHATGKAVDRLRRSGVGDRHRGQRPEHGLLQGP